MEKIDRLGWTAGFSFTSYGARIGVRASDPKMLPTLLNCLPPKSRLSRSADVDSLYSIVVGGENGKRGVRRYHLLYSGAARLTRSMDWESVTWALGSDVHFQVAISAPRKLFVHAGVVGWRGKALVLPGRSFSGKTSLVAALVQAGATYYSDEYAVLDRKGRVFPYPKPLSIRDHSGAKPKLLPVEELGGRRGTKPLPVGLIALTRYEPGKRWRPRKLSPGQALLALLDNTVLARVRPKFALRRLQQAVPDALTLKGKRGEAAELADLLLSRCNQTFTKED